MNSKKLHIFLSGSVHKGSGDKRESSFFWSSQDEEVLIENITNAEVIILNPNTISTPKWKFKDRYTSDLEMVIQSDVMIVDARTKKGLGVGAEMMMAHYESIPVYSLATPGSHYRNEILNNDSERIEWIHPFVFGLSHKIYDSISNIANDINVKISENEITLKNRVIRYRNKITKSIINPKE